jgi:polar amino acid transport system permease protein
MRYDFDFSGMLYRAPAFGAAILVTLRLTGLSCVLGSVLGIPIAALMLLPRPFGGIIAFLVHAVRAIPDLVLFFFYYYFPYQAIFAAESPSPFICALLAMTTALSVFAGDLFHEAIRQAPRNQMLGVRALGFTERQVARHVIFPAVVRHTLPALAAFWIGILKMSSLASVLGVTDVVYVAKVGMAQSYRSLEAWITVALIYVTLVMPLVYVVKFMQRRPWLRRQ